MSETPKYTTTPNRIPEGWTSGDLSVELSSRRTGMSFQRTRMSADRTLMSIIRTALSLIGFGFTIFQFFRYLRDNAHATDIVPAHAAINFSTALVVLGVIFLLGASRCRVPAIIYGIGILALAAALLLALLGEPRVDALITWWAQQPALAIRAWCALAALPGVLILYAALPPGGAVARQNERGSS